MGDDAGDATHANVPLTDCYRPPQDAQATDQFTVFPGQRVPTQCCPGPVVRKVAEFLLGPFLQFFQLLERKIGPSVNPDPGFHKTFYRSLITRQSLCASNFYIDV
jgi:hypothetical protein